MKQIVTKITLLFVLFLGLNNNTQAQCFATAGQYGGPLVAPVASGTASTTQTDCWGGEYTPVTGLTACTQYTATTSVPGSYWITVTDPTNAFVYGYGPAPLTFTMPIAGDIRMHRNTSASPGCGTAATNCVASITHVGAVLPPVGSLSGTFTIPSCAFPTLASFINTLNTYGVAGPVTGILTAAETAPFNGYQLGSAILNASVNATNTITILGGGNTITAWTGGLSTTNDGIFTINGTDYITINNLWLTENPLNTTAALQMEWGYGLMKLNAVAPLDGCQNVKIENCTITLNKAGAGSKGIYAANHTNLNTTALVPTSATDANSNNTFRANTIQNLFQGIVVVGYNALSPYTLFDQNNIIGGTSIADANTIQNFGGPLVANTVGVSTAYQNGLIVQNNTINNMNGGGTASIGVTWGLSIGSSINSNLTVRKNNINLTGGLMLGSALNGVVFSIGAGGVGGNTVNIDSNSVVIAGNAGATNLVYGYSLTGNATFVNGNANTYSLTTSSSTGTHYGLISSMTQIGVNPIFNYNDNKIGPMTRTAASGGTYGHYTSGTGLAGGLFSIQRNKVSDITHNALSSGLMYTFYDFANSGAVANKIMGFDTVQNINNGANTFYGMYTYGYGGTLGEIKNNYFNNITTRGATTYPGPYCISTNNNCLVHDNIVSGVTSLVNTANFTRGIYFTVGAGIKMYNNLVTNIESAITTGGLIEGINVGGTSYDLYNNQVSDLRTPAGSSTCPVYGIVANTGTCNLYHNTVNLNPVSSGINFGATGIYYNSATLDLRNNIVRVNAIAAGTGFVAAVRRNTGVAATIPANYAATSNNNILWAPNATNSYLYAEGAANPLVNAYNLTNDPGFNSACGSLYKTFMAGRDANTNTENNLVGSLVAGTFVPTGLSFADNSSVAVTANPGQSSDFNLVARGAIYDRGAIEFSGTPNDVAGPTITYAPIANATYCTNLPTITATITDASGVSTTNPPRLYYKYAGNNDTYVGNTSADNGWKYIVGTGTAPNYTFAMNAALLTSTPIVTDVIQYFVAAEDMATVPNFSATTAAFTACPTTVVLPLSVFPTLATPVKNQMTIIAVPPITMAATATPATVCLGTNSTLTLADTADGSQTVPTVCAVNIGANLNQVGNYISNVTISGGIVGINNNSVDAGASMYEDFSTSVPPAVFLPGTIANISLAGIATNVWSVYVDWDKDGIFNGTNELVTFVGAYSASPWLSTFAIPATAGGKYKLRVAYSWSPSGIISPCTPTSGYAEYEDYSISVKKINSFPNGSITWSPTSPATIVTNPNRTVNANVINATTIFTVTATDAGGCTYTATTQVTVNPLTAGSATATPLVICEGLTSQLVVTPTGGGAPYTYSWLPAGTLSNAAIANPVATPLTTTIYTVTVADACGGSYTQTNVVVVNPAPTVTGTATPATVCTGSTTTLTGSGNASSYSWSGGATNGVAFIPAASNVYTVTGTSINGCTATSTVAVTKIAPFYDTTGNDAAICLGGSANLIAGDSIPALPPGCIPTYTSGNTFGDFIQAVGGFITNVTGANPSTYTNYAAPTGALTVGTPSTLNVTMGTYSQNDVAVWVDYNQNNLFEAAEKIGEFFNLGTGAIATFIINAPGTALNGTTKMRVREADQIGASNLDPCVSYGFGETEDYTVTISGGITIVPPVYTYTWMPGSLAGAAQTVMPVATTTYTVTQTDANGCTTTATQMVTVNPNPTTTVVSTTVASCTPGCDATASMDATGGTAPYAYTVTASATTAGNVVSAICATTTYTVTATDANGCIGTVSTTGVGATPSIVTATPAAVSVCQNAMTTLVGGGAVTYAWSGGITDNTPFAVTASTIYTVTGTDANNCTNTATADVTMLALPTVTATPATISVCQNTNTTLTGGGASTYTWSGGITDAVPFAVTASTIYTVTGTDASGCSNTATSDVTMTASPVITATPNTVSNCVGSSTDLTASGGLTYTWMPGSLSGAMITVPAYTGSATYTVTGLDAGGCAGTAVAVVTTTLPSGDLTLATPGNASSNTGLECKATTHPNDGQPLTYFDNSCLVIAGIQEPNGGFALGSVNTCVTVDATVQLVNTQPYVRRWFEMTPTNNGPATVSLYLTLDDFLDYNASPAAAGWPPLPTTASSTDPNIPNIRITKNDAGVLSVITPTVSYDVVNARFILTFPVAGFSQFRVHSINNANAPLPVTYKMFTARKENTVDVLDWITGTEENNKQFNVERSSNSKEFTKIGVVASLAPNGNSQIDIKYTFVDEKPMTGHNYYRLAQEDIDGKINYSETIDLVWGANGSTISMYPNPTTDILNVDINSEKASNITIRVMDMSGRTVKTTEARTEQGVNSVKINLNEVASGLYNVQILENGKLIVTERVNKK